jgi:hypothetical protein
LLPTPKPFDEDLIKNKFWEREEWDENIPSPGFISDFLLTLRGIETPTKFQVWTALSVLSSVLKRDAWLEWHPRKFFANLYVFIVAPPAVCAKTTAISWADSALLPEFHKLIEDPVLQAKKRLRISRTKITPEGLFKFLEPRKANVFVEKTKSIPVELDSQGCFIVGELATFLGKQQYNVGLIDMLTNLYDCKEIEDSYTLSRGSEELRNVYVTIIGGTTPDGLAASIPEQAFGDGFVSRLNIVSEDFSPRCYPIPLEVKGGPTAELLRERLAWIAETAQGGYTFSEDAYAAYCTWYRPFKKSLRENSNDENKTLSRYAVHLLKLALLIRVQRYERGNVIELRDFEEAQRLLHATFKSGKKLTDTVRKDSMQRVTAVIRDYLQKKSAVKRKKLLCSHSDRFKVVDVNTALRELKELGMVRIVNKGKTQEFISSYGDELYEWTGEDG